MHKRRVIHRLRLFKHNLVCEFFREVISSKATIAEQVLNAQVHSLDSVLDFFSEISEIAHASTAVLYRYLSIKDIPFGREFRYNPFIVLRIESRKVLYSLILKEARCGISFRRYDYCILPCRIIPVAKLYNLIARIRNVAIRIAIGL